MKHSNRKAGLFLRMLVLFSLSALQGCSFYKGKVAGERQPVDLSSLEEVVPRVEAKSKYGNPPSYVVFGKRYHVMKDSKGYKERGLASWYGKKFHGRRTSSGETYDMYQYSAAHKTLPLPTYVRVRNLENGREMVLRVNDRGPFYAGRIIDLSYVAAVKLGVYAKGTSKVEVEAIDVHDSPASAGSPTFRHGKPLAKRNAGGAAGGEGDRERSFFIQVGAYRESQNAEGIVARLRRLNISKITISEKEILNSIFYRVWIGPFLNGSEVGHMVDLISRAGIRSYSVVER